MSRTYQMCTRCVMDTSDPAIVFDASGVCNHCREYDAHPRARIVGDAGRAALEALVSDVRSAGARRPYDCVIGVSGGVDSTFVAYQVKQLGLRPLAVHLDNGWNSELAVDNIARTLRTLEIDLHTHVVDWEEFRDIHLAFLKAGVINSEIPTDHAISAVLYRVAAEQGVRYIITGRNTATEGILPTAWVYNNRDLRHLRAIHRRFGTRRLRTFPTMGLLRYLYWTHVRGITEVPLLDYLAYDKAAAKRVISAELGWRDYGGKHFESVYTAFYQAYILPTKFHVDKRRAHLASLVVSGQMTRSAAIEELKRPAVPETVIAEYRTFVAKKLGLDASAFDALMGAEPVPHTAYPNSEWIFSRLVSLRRWFRRVTSATATSGGLPREASALSK